MRDGREAPHSSDRAHRPGSSGAETQGPPRTFRVRTRGDPCSRIVRAVAAVTGDRPTELPPLSDSVDPDALRRLAAEASPAAALRASFTYAGCEVSVAGTGELVVRGPGATE